MNHVLTGEEWGRIVKTVEDLEKAVNKIADTADKLATRVDQLPCAVHEEWAKTNAKRGNWAIGLAIMILLAILAILGDLAVKGRI